MQSYTFHDFILKPEELSLYYNKKRLELGLKGFKLLVALVQNQGKLIPKDELIAAAWEGQIVTDGTLNKQIERVRQILGSECPETIFIETVRGVGYKFVADIKTHKNRKRELAKWQKAMASISIIPLLLFLYFYPFGNQTNNPSDKPTMPFNIAVIPSAQGDDYMNVGGLSYLSILLDKNPRILSVSPKKEWFENQDKKQLAVEIESQKKLDYVLLVEINDLDEGKSARLELKNNDQFSKKIILTSISYKQLFAEINTWVNEALQLKELQNHHLFNQHLSNDSFAVESFLRGIKEQRIFNNTKAIQYFKMAITQDDDFDLARIKEIEALIKSNDYDTAIALIDTLEKNRQLNSDLGLFLMILKANVMIYTNKPIKAEGILIKAIKLAKEKDYDSVLAMALYLQGVVYGNLNQEVKAIESAIEYQAFIESTFKDPFTTGQAANQLALAYMGSQQLHKAEEQINKAIVVFEKVNHIEGMFDSYDTLARILYDLAKIKQAQVVIDKGLSIKDQIENKRLVMWFLETIAAFQIENGSHNQALITMKEIESLSLNLKTEQVEILALGIQLELAIRRKELDKIKYTSALAFAKIKDIKPNIPWLWKGMMVKVISANIEIGRFDLARQQITSLEKSLNTDNEAFQGEINTLNAYLMYKLGQLNESKALLDKFIMDSIEKNQFRLSLILAYMNLDIAIEQNDYNKVGALINKIDFINPFPYPYLKYKAKLAAHSGNYFEANTLMQEMKNTSNQWWNTQDQILLDSYTNHIKEK